jgi:hypothetical protein
MLISPFVLFDRHELSVALLSSCTLDIMYYDCRFFGTIWADTLFLLPFASITNTVTPIPTFQITMHRLWRNEHIPSVTGLELFR